MRRPFHPRGIGPGQLLPIGQGVVLGLEHVPSFSPAKGAEHRRITAIGQATRIPLEVAIRAAVRLEWSCRRCPLAAPSATG